MALRYIEVLLSVPSVVIIKRTNQIDWRVQAINARGSDPDPVVCMKVRFEAKVTRSFSLSPRRFAPHSPFGEEKFQEKPLGPEYVFGCSNMSAILTDSRMEVRRYQRMEINGFNVVLEKFS